MPDHRTCARAFSRTDVCTTGIIFVWHHLRCRARGERDRPGPRGAREPVWDQLYPAEQARILRLLIERIDVAPDGISVTLHAASIRSLVAELASEDAALNEPALMDAAD